MLTQIVFQIKKPDNSVSRSNLEYSTDLSAPPSVTIYFIAQGLSLEIDESGPVLIKTDDSKLSDYDPKIKVDILINGNEKFDLLVNELGEVTLIAGDIVEVTSTLKGKVTTTLIVITVLNLDDDEAED